MSFVLAIGALSVLLLRLQPPPAPVEPQMFHRQIQAAERALRLGKFRSAMQELEGATRFAQQHAELLASGEQRRLDQWRRQAELLDALLPEALGDLLRHAAELTALDEQEWLAVFADRYQGKAVLFDAEILRDRPGHYRLDYHVFVGDRPAIIELGNLRLLVKLPLDRPQRILFGWRLASIRVEGAGTWVIRAQPDSGVLLTEEAAAAGCCPQPLDELRPVLKRQAQWLEESVGRPGDDLP